MTKAVRRQYGTLDGMRGVAALAVVVVHAPSLMGPISAVSAGLAVDLFFVMSGFIIAHAYEGQLASDLSTWRFMLLRLVRLYPLYLVGLALGVGEVLAEIQFGDAQLWTFDYLLKAAAVGLLMLPSATGPQDPSVAPMFPLNPPSWSLFFEVVVNIAYGALFPILGTRVLAAVVAAAGLTLVVLGILNGNLHFGSHWANCPGGLPRVVYSFGAGVLIYRLARNGIPTIQVPPTLILVACGGIFAAAPGTYTGVFELTCVLVLLPGLVVLGASAEPSGRLRSIFSFLGLISYGVYSLHYPLALGLKGALQKLAGPDISHLAPWSGLAFVAGLIIFCWVMDRIYDAPVRKFIGQLLKTRQARQAVKATN